MTTSNSSSTSFKHLRDFLFFSISILLSRTTYAAVYSTEPRSGIIPSLTDILGADAVQKGFPVERATHQRASGSLKHEHLLRGRAALESTDSDLFNDTIVGSVIQPSMAYYSLFAYFVKMQLGTPVQDILLELDTGSNVLWTQCSNCNPCVPTPPDANYDPTKSSTYIDLISRWSIRYGDETYIIGNMAADTLTIDSLFGDRIVLPNTTFLCGTNNSSPLTPNVGTGILGLDRDSEFLRQLAALNHSVVFRHCFTNPLNQPNATSFFSVGKINEAESGDLFKPDSDAPMLYTPLRVDVHTPYISLNLSGISVGGQRLDIEISTLNSEYPLNPNQTETRVNFTIIDSGTFATNLPASIFAVVAEAYRNLTSANLVTVLADDNFTLCFNATADQQFAATFPSVSYFFPMYKGNPGDEIEVIIPPDNLLLRVDDTTVCLLFRSAPEGPFDNVAILGNYNQQNFLVEYDYEENRLGFQRASCAFSH